jgi:hypothetical protein
MLASTEGNITSRNQSANKNQNLNDEEILEEEERLALRQLGHFTISDLSSAIGMEHEEKTMCRVLAEIRKVHPTIEEKANRFGRRF